MNKDNLIKLRDYVANNVVDGQLNMNCYSNGDKDSDDPKVICGTVACYVGYLPLALGAEFERYNYCRNFPGRLDYEQLCWEALDIHFGGTLWTYLFDMSWGCVDPTVEGCIARTNYILEHGKAPSWITAGTKEWKVVRDD